MKKLLFLTITLLSLYTSSINAQTVYVTKTGTKYHEDDCSYLKYSKYYISLSKALKLGYTSCSRCEPPKKAKYTGYSTNTQPTYLYQTTTTQQTYRTTYSVRCNGITQKGYQCKRKTKNANGYCWQH